MSIVVCRWRGRVGFLCICLVPGRGAIVCVSMPNSTEMCITREYHLVFSKSKYRILCANTTQLLVLIHSNGPCVHFAICLIVFATDALSSTLKSTFCVSSHDVGRSRNCDHLRGPRTALFVTQHFCGNCWKISILFLIDTITIGSAEKIAYTPCRQTGRSGVHFVCVVYAINTVFELLFILSIRSETPQNHLLSGNRSVWCKRLRWPHIQCSRWHSIS